MKAAPHIHPVRIYYEDTDVSGLVYHANYLRYMERAREHLIGPTELVRLLEEEGTGFVVYHAEMTFKEGAKLGDVIEVRTSVEPSSDFRLVFQQDIYHQKRDTVMVEGLIHLVCVDAVGKLVKLPTSVREAFQVS